MKFTFRTTFLAILLGFLVGTVSLVGASSYYNARFTVDDLSAQLLEQTSARIDQQVQALVGDAATQSALHQRLLSAGVLRPDDFPALVAYFLQAMEVHPGIASFFLGLESTGESTGVSRLHGRLSIWQSNRNPRTGRLEQRDFWPDAYPSTPYAFDPDRPAPDIRTRPWYTAARAAHRPTWTETYTFLGVAGAEAPLGVTAATPVYLPSGALAGVLSADFDLAGLSAFLATLRVGRHGFAFVVERRRDGRERLIAHPDRALLADPRSGLRGPIADGRVRAILDASRRHRGSHGTVRFLDAQQRYVGAYRAVAGPHAPPWIVGIVVPEHDVLARVERGNAIAAAVALGAFLLAILAGIYVARQVARPLEALSQEMSAIAELRLDPRPVLRSSVLEVDRVATTTEEMKTGLRSFQKYVPADLVRELLASRREASLGGERRRVTVYFSDIVDFTSISERTSPEAVVEQLREYLGALDARIREGGGAVDKFIGDAVMAFWGAPGDNPRHALDACRTALRIQRALAQLEALWTTQGRPALHTRIGLHTGDVLVGNIGSESRLNYTVMGDAVNLASRLEGLNKLYDTRILVSEATRAEAGGTLVARPLDWVSVKGRAQPVQVFELLGERGELEPALEELAALHAEALARYRDRDFAEAARGFREVLARRPDDGPATLMLRRSEGYLERPPGEAWDGVTRLTSK